MFFRKKWALVLSGGGAKGLAHIGVLKFIDEIGVKPDMIAGTSVGAIIGGFYACGMTGREIEDFIVNDFEFKHFFDMKSLHLPDISISKAIVIGESLKNLFLKQGVDTGVKLHNIISKLTQDKNFGEETIPFACNSVDLINHCHVIHRKGKIADAIRASMSVPGFFTPFQMGEMLLVDGGVYNNLPVSIPRQLGIKNVIAINLNQNIPENIEKFQTGMDVIIEALFINSRITEKNPANIPDLEIFASDKRSNIDLSNPESAINHGYERAKESEEDIMEVAVPAYKRFFNRKK